MGTVSLYNAYVCIHPHSIPVQTIPYDNVVHQSFNQSILLSGCKTNCVVVPWGVKVVTIKHPSCSFLEESV